MGKRITYDDIARECGLSKMSISRYFHARQTLSASAAEKIEDALRKLNYTENKAARILAGANSECIGILLPDSADPLLLRLLTDILKTYDHTQYKFMVFVSSGQVEKELEYLRELKTYQAEGIIVLENTLSKAQLEQSGIPCVFFNAARFSEKKPAAYEDRLLEKAKKYFDEKHCSRRYALEISRLSITDLDSKEQILLPESGKPGTLLKSVQQWLQETVSRSLEPAGLLLMDQISVRLIDLLSMLEEKQFEQLHILSLGPELDSSFSHEGILSADTEDMARQALQLLKKQKENTAGNVEILCAEPVLLLKNR